MARSKGYRPKKEVKDEVAELRTYLATLRESDWVKAGLIMQEIAQLVGRRLGPSNGRPTPRACRFCKYFGHTKQHCPARKEAQDRELEQLAKECEAEDAEIRARPTPPPRPTTDCEIELNDKLGWPWRRDPDIGPIMINSRNAHLHKACGKWAWARSTDPRYTWQVVPNDGPLDRYYELAC